MDERLQDGVEKHEIFLQSYNVQEREVCWLERSSTVKEVTY